ncbi:bifunctional glutamate N-acetyltransferase/amino-acid acetyltransferase ArgJ [Clostridium grantii]|uniref:Arginine biosynthesis bifunctional protein ArgJ n=1 Tax=Clostridium grantii DSM 8605 TaxID=1121316 RepID=A0A1M5XR55_9CLOT|nr:bifunctional glutamate N-acetyltransferase/amino-acid acetyltransferase ArgJ [Clostridium grantii]SHI01743.1 glutamate N-acetyltransferase [Clostridium grantii DSM 8605]
MKIVNGNFLNNVKGYTAAGVCAGFKKSGKKDLALIFSECSAVSAATFTTNKAKAACVLINMENIKNETTRAIITNSGQANACTGYQGYEDAVNITKLVSNELNIQPQEVLQASTGVIGIPIPMDKMEIGIKNICSSLSIEGGEDASNSILTTDTVKKVVSVNVEIDGKKVGISGMAKGSGMINPNMATMLSYIITDANISKDMLNSILKESIENSYNMISVDGDTSTNDMVLSMANGMAENNLIEKKDEKYFILKEAIDYVNTELSKKIARDGEGATKLFETIVVGANTILDAKKCAKAVVSSNLVKCAIFGSDANWGRVICALGYSGADFDPYKVDLYFKSAKGEVQVAREGMLIDYSETLAKEILDEEYITIFVDLNSGESEATSWGCDLTYKYVEINGEYRT